MTQSEDSLKILSNSVKANWTFSWRFFKLIVCFFVLLVALFPFYAEISSKKELLDYQKSLGLDVANESKYNLLIKVLLNDIYSDLRNNTINHEFIKLTHKSIVFSLICLVLVQFIMGILSYFRYLDKMSKEGIFLFLCASVPPFFLGIVLQAQLGRGMANGTDYHYRYALAVLCLTLFSLGVFWGFREERLKKFYAHTIHMLNTLKVDPKGVFLAFFYEQEKTKTKDASKKIGMWTLLVSQFLFIFVESFVICYVFHIPGIGSILIQETLRERFRMWLLLYPFLFQIILYWSFLAILASLFLSAGKNILAYFRFCNHYKSYGKLKRKI